MKIQLDGKCDLTRYPLTLSENQRITAVTYSDQTLPRIPRKGGGYFVPPNAKLDAIGDPPDLIPDTPIAAYWYTRTCSEHRRLPMFYHYRPANLLIVFPAPYSDGDRITVTISEIEPELEPA